MAKITDELTESFPCPECGHEFTESLTRLKDDPVLTCPACGTKVHVDSGGSTREVADKLDEIDRLLDRIGKA